MEQYDNNNSNNNGNYKEDKIKIMKNEMPRVQPKSDIYHDILDGIDIGEILAKLKQAIKRKLNPGSITQPLKDQFCFNRIVDPNNGNEMYRTEGLLKVMKNEEPPAFAQRAHAKNAPIQVKVGTKRRKKTNIVRERGDLNEKFGSIPILNFATVTGDESREELYCQAFKLYYLWKMHPQSQQETRDYFLNLMVQMMEAKDQLNDFAEKGAKLAGVMYNCITFFVCLFFSAAIDGCYL